MHRLIYPNWASMFDKLVNIYKSKIVFSAYHRSLERYHILGLDKERDLSEDKQKHRQQYSISRHQTCLPTSLVLQGPF